MRDIGTTITVRCVPIDEVERVLRDIGINITYNIRYDDDCDPPYEESMNIVNISTIVAEYLSERIDNLTEGGVFYWRDIVDILLYMAYYNHIPCDRYIITGLRGN